MDGRIIAGWRAVARMGGRRGVGFAASTKDPWNASLFQGPLENVYATAHSKRTSVRPLAENEFKKSSCRRWAGSFPYVPRKLKDVYIAERIGQLMGPMSKNSCKILRLGSCHWTSRARAPDAFSMQDRLSRPCIDALIPGGSSEAGLKKRRSDAPNALHGASALKAARPKPRVPTNVWSKA